MMIIFDYLCLGSYVVSAEKQTLQAATRYREARTILTELLPPDSPHLATVRNVTVMIH
jgi:hypothetical protein